MPMGEGPRLIQSLLIGIRLATRVLSDRRASVGRRIGGVPFGCNGPTRLPVVARQVAANELPPRLADQSIGR